MTNIKFINRGDYFITLNTTPILVFYSMEEIEEFKINHTVKIKKDKEIKEDIQQNKYCCPNEVVIKLWNAGYSFNDNNQSKVNYRGYKINRPTITDMAEVCYQKKTVIIRVARMDDGYSAACDMIDGWIVAVTGDFCSLQKEVKESIEFYLDCAKLDGDKYNPIFDENYKLEYQFDVRSLLCYYQKKIFSLAALD